MSKFSVYIIWSKKLAKYYTGSTELAPEKRLEQHNSSFNENSFTTNGIPWEVFLVIPCESRDQAIGVEKHIKKMKSRKYIENLGKYTEMRGKVNTGILIRSYSSVG